MVKNIAFISFIIVFVLGLISIIIFPYYTINPGIMIEDHQQLKNDCLSCHSLGEGVKTEKCTVCHELPRIGLVLASGIKRDELNFISNSLHQSIINIQCYDCHTEHNGLSRENATLNFKHEVLSEKTRNECVNCHSLQKPEDKIHELITLNCSECHSTENWKPSHFKHEQLGERKNECRGCHENVKPGDVFHKSIGLTIQCVQCHTTAAWKPSTLDHTKYFIFDRNHPSNCSDCHDVNKSFKNYTCYNCHEHNPSKIEREHTKEGIRNFNNCVECHRSGDKKEVEKLEKSFRGKADD